MNKKYTIDEVKKYTEKYSTSECLSKTYVNNGHKLLFRCICGRKFKRSFSSFKSGGMMCKICGYDSSSKTQRFKLQKIISKIEDLGLIFISSVGKYKNAHSKIKLRCKKCEKNYLTTWADLSQKRNLFCRKCLYKEQGKRRAKSFEEIKKYIKDIGIIVLSDGSNYKNNSSKIDIICLKCGSVYSVTWRHFRRGENRTCRDCSYKRIESKIASELKEYCKCNYNSISEYKGSKNRKTKIHFRYDIYIPKYKLFIEVNGLQHYHMSSLYYKNKEDFSRRINYDKIKKAYAKKNGLYLEIDLRKIKVIEDAIKMVDSVIDKK